MRLSRRVFCAAASAAAGAGAVRFAAGAAEFTLKYGNDAPLDHPITRRALEAAQRVRNDTAGRVAVEVYPFNSLGGDTAMLGQLRLGALDLYSAPDTVIASIAPVMNITGIPFAFRAYRDAWNAADGPLQQYLHDGLAKAGVYRFSKTWDFGMRELANNVGPVHVPGDFKGMKVRVPEAPIAVQLFRGLGAAPTAMNGNEVYTALQTHVVDACESPYLSIKTYKYFEVVKYVSGTNHMWSGISLVANNDKWQKIPANLRATIESDFNACAVLEREDMARNDALMIAWIKSQGIAVNTTDQRAFVEQLRRQGLYAQWRDTFAPEVWSALEKSVGKLA